MRREGKLTEALAAADAAIEVATDAEQLVTGVAARARVLAELGETDKARAELAKLRAFPVELRQSPTTLTVEAIEAVLQKR